MIAQVSKVLLCPYEATSMEPASSLVPLDVNQVHSSPEFRLSLALPVGELQRQE